MNKSVKTGLLITLCVIVVVAVLAFIFCRPSYFKSWNEDSAPLQALQSYVSDVTDETSPNYIRHEDRIAVFDMDGTLMSEKYPTYFEWLMLAHRILDDPDYKDKATPQEIELAKGIRSLKQDSKIPSNYEKWESEVGGKAYEGMTLYDYYNYVRQFKKTKADGFENMNLGEAFFEPMKEVIKYLEDYGFIVYICSGTDRFLDRALLSDIFPEIPSSQIIGMDYKVITKNQGSTDPLEYEYQPGENLIRTSELIQKSIKMNKAAIMAQEIGKLPVLSFGNSTGDASMLNFTISNPDYKSLAFIIKWDDLDREYGNLETSKKVQDLADKYGWITISMKDDWKTIYGEGVSKSK